MTAATERERRRLGAECWLASFDERDICAGKLERCHLVPRQLLRRLGIPEAEHWDRDLLVVGCAFHHKRFDDGCFRVTADELPVTFRDAVDAVGQLLDYDDRRELLAWLSRKYD